MPNRCQIDPRGGEGEAGSRVGFGQPVPNKPASPQARDQNVYRANLHENKRSPARSSLRASTMASKLVTGQHAVEDKPIPERSGELHPFISGDRQRGSAMEGVGENLTRFFPGFLKNPEKTRLKPGKNPEKSRLKPGKNLLENVESTQKVGDLVRS